MTAAGAQSGRRWRIAYMLAFLVFLYVPVLLLPLFSLNDAIYVTFPLAGFTTRWYAKLAGNRMLLHTLWNSLWVAGAASLVSTALGVLAALAFTRYRFRGRRPAYAAVMAAMVLPEIMVGVALLILVTSLGLPLGLPAVTFAHVLFCLPFATSVLMSRLEGFDRSLEEASRDLGETAAATFRRVTLPLILPAVVASLLLTFTISFDEFVLAFFLTSTETTLPVYIWGQLRFPASLPETLALGSLILIATAVLVVTAQFLRGDDTAHGR